jgi:hypothetical protein
MTLKSPLSLVSFENLSTAYTCISLLHFFYTSGSQTRSEGRWREYILAYTSYCDLSEADICNDRLVHNHHCAVNTPTVSVQEEV